ncbi:hypothetical protein ADL27_32525 [Streptomyces sp. NRRL F-6602]|nr:hypothetical protein ADL27_32525 [Streptomyces sp. NRRL F-6602]
MAKKVLIVDDIDGTEENVETVNFTYKGTRYTIDLSKKNRDAFDKAMDKYLKAATELGTSGGGGSSSGSSANAQHLARVRAWARDAGHEVSNRGRIPAPIVEAYNKTHPDDAYKG